MRREPRTFDEWLLAELPEELHREAMPEGDPGALELWWSARRMWCANRGIDHLDVMQAERRRRRARGRRP